MDRTKKECDEILVFLYLDPLYKEFSLCAKGFRSKKDQNPTKFSDYLKKMKEAWCIISFIGKIEDMRDEAKR